MFELLGQSAGDPYVDEDDTPIVLRSWQAHNFLITALHIKGSASRINVLGITEVQVAQFISRAFSLIFVWYYHDSAFHSFGLNHTLRIPLKTCLQFRVE